MVIRPFISFPLLPLKFRTVGFPQYGFKRDVETPSSALHPQRLIGVSSPRQAFTRSYCPVVWAYRPIRTRRMPTRTLSSSGPWLVQRLFCPPVSLLTMTASELLAAPPVLVVMPTGLRPPEVPQFTLPGFDSVPPPLLRWLPRADDESKRRAWPSPILYRFGNHFNPHTRLRVAPFTKLQR